MNGLRTLYITIVLLITACNGGDRQTSSEELLATGPRNALVIASNYPIYFFARRIAAGVEDAPDIVFPDIDGDPAFWIPDAEQIQLLQSADVVLLNGAGAEPWLDLITIDHRRLVDTSVMITDRLISLEDAIAHQHGPEGEHSHQGTAFTTWLDPQLAIAQARVVTDALVELVPAGELTFKVNLSVLEQDLNELDALLAELFAQLHRRPVLFSHPVYQYLQRRYGINGQSVHWEPEQEPTTSAWFALQQINVTHSATIMIWEDEPLISTGQRLSDVGITSVDFHIVGNRPAQGDYLSVMHENAKRLETMLQGAF